MDRRARILSLIDPLAMRGVEVGPSFSPIVTKASGADVVVIDHADATTLREKYAVHGVDVDAIEDVDVLWSGGPLAPPLQHLAPFDYIIASHVIEHLPDPLGFLADCESLLKPSGVLSLVVPDSRYCFDCLRPLTTIGQWVDARLAGRVVHTPGTVLDHTLHAVKRGEIVWNANTTGPLAMVHQRDHVDATLEQASTTGDYVDVHAWVFTPPSFRYLVDMARALSFTSLAVADSHDTVGAEFYVTLRKQPEGTWSSERGELFDDRLATITAAGLRSVAEPAGLPLAAAADTTTQHSTLATLRSRVAAHTPESLRSLVRSAERRLRARRR